MILKPPLFAKPIHGHPLGPDGGLASMWAMNEGRYNSTFTKIFDLSGNGRNGIATGVTNEISWQSGPDGSVVDFVGNSIAGFVFSPITLQSTVPWTIIFKAVTDGDASEEILLGTYNALNNYIWLREGSYLRFHNSAGTSTNFTSVTSFTSWATYALVAKGDGNLHLYVDGVFKETLAATTSIIIDCIGNGYNSATFAFDGRVSHVSIYNNRSLSASEIAQLYWNPFCMFEYDLIELWSAATQGEAPAGTILPQITTAYMRVTA